MRRAARAIARVEQMQNTSMPMPDIPSPDAYWEGLRPHLRPFSPDEQRAAIAVADAQLADALGISTVESRELLQRDAIKPFIYRDREGRVLGFGGLATTPMHHRFEVDGRELSTPDDSRRCSTLLSRPHSIDPGKCARCVPTTPRLTNARPRVSGDQSTLRHPAPLCQSAGGFELRGICFAKAGDLIRATAFNPLFAFGGG